MDYFQGVVTEYLRANRATFVNTECLIQLSPGDAPARGAHWYCDAVAVNLAERSVHLCEVTYSSTLYSLVARLSAWAANWAALKSSICRDCSVPPEWSVQPWAFIPKEREELLTRRLVPIVSAGSPDVMPSPRVTFLEDVVPWKYRSWDRKLEALADEAK